MFKKVTEFFGGLSLPTKDISGEKIYEHLINIGIDAEVIPEGSPDDPDLPPFIVPPSELEFSYRLGDPPLVKRAYFTM